MIIHLFAVTTLHTFFWGALADGAGAVLQKNREMHHSAIPFARLNESSPIVLYLAHATVNILTRKRFIVSECSKCPCFLLVCQNVCKFSNLAATMTCKFVFFKCMLFILHWMKLSYVVSTQLHVIIFIMDLFHAKFVIFHYFSLPHLCSSRLFRLITTFSLLAGFQN